MQMGPLIMMKSAFLNVHSTAPSLNPCWSWPCHWDISAESQGIGPLTKGKYIHSFICVHPLCYIVQLFAICCRTGETYRRDILYISVNNRQPVIPTALLRKRVIPATTHWLSMSKEQPKLTTSEAVDIPGFPDATVKCNGVWYGLRWRRMLLQCYVMMMTRAS